MDEASVATVDTTIPTQGIKYAGSKLKLLPQILELVQSTRASHVLDGFAGTTRVSQALSKSGYQVTANDVAIWSKVFATAYLRNTRPVEHYKELINHLNQLSPVDGWFTQNYGGTVTSNGAIQADGLKKPWQRHNTMQLDAIRIEIDRLSLDEVEKCVALTSLILALDKVDNTLGHYVSYLKDWSQRSHKKLHLEVPALFINELDHQVIHGDVFDCVSDRKFDLAYLDPPYGSKNEKMPPSRVRYASYYHLWTTVCLNDRPELSGKSKRRMDCSDKLAASEFEEFRRNPDTGRFLAVESIERLLQQTHSDWILLSYSNGGRATATELHACLKNCGEIVEVREIDYQRNVMAKMKWTDEWLTSDGRNKELLFLLKKN